MRDQVLFELTEVLVADLDRALKPTIERYLGGYLRQGAKQRWFKRRIWLYASIRFTPIARKPKPVA